jgi:hypothetical protein
MTVKPVGLLALSVAAGVAVGFAGSSLMRFRSVPHQNKTVVWEALEGHEGSDLQRTKTPSGWVVESPDGFMLAVFDPEHKWLGE